MAPSEGQGLSKLEFYPVLFRSVDAVVTPFSTMAVEAASFGLPVMCVGYNHDNHANYDWVRQSHELHLYAMRHSDWCVVCERPEAVVERCRQLVAMTGDDAIRQSAVAATAFVFQNGRQSPAGRW